MSHLIVLLQQLFTAQSVLTTLLSHLRSLATQYSLTNMGLKSGDTYQPSDKAKRDHGDNLSGQNCHFLLYSPFLSFELKNISTPLKLEHNCYLRLRAQTGLKMG